MDRAPHKARVLRKWRIHHDCVVLGASGIDSQDLPSPGRLIRRQLSVDVCQQRAAHQAHEVHLSINQTDHPERAVESDTALYDHLCWLLAVDEDVTAPVDQVDSDGNARVLNSKGAFTVPADGQVIYEAPGSGGYGPVAERDPEALRDDMINGYVSVDMARHDYGIDDPVAFMAGVVP